MTRLLSVTAFLSINFASLGSAASIKIAFHNGGVTVTGFNSQPDGSIFASSSETLNNVANNGGVGLTFSGFALSDTSGAATGATLSGNAGFASFNNNGWGGGTDDWVAMEGWYGLREAESFTVAGLPSEFTNGGYTITIFGDSDTTSRTMNYTIGGTTQTINDAGTFAGTFVEGSNITTFTGLSSSGFTITGNDAATPGRSAVNAIIIESVPEPSSLFLLGLAGLGFCRRKR